MRYIIAAIFGTDYANLYNKNILESTFTVKRTIKLITLYIIYQA